MASTTYPLKYDAKLHDISGYSNDQIGLYVKTRLLGYDYTDNTSCELQGGKVQKVRIINSLGQKITDIEFCASLEYDNLPTHVMVDLNGNIKIFKQESIGFLGTVKNLIEAALRSFQVFSMIALTFDIEPMLTDMRLLANKFHVPDNKIGDWLTKAIEMYQRGAAWIDSTLKVSFIWKAHQLTRILSNDYNEYWRDQERQLGYMSQRVFGNTSQLAIYVHLTEMIYQDLALAAGFEHQEARKRAMLHGAEQAGRISSDMRRYELSPYLLWSDLMDYTFGEKNPFLDPDRQLIGEELITKINKVTEEFEKTKSKLDRLGLYQAELDKINLFTLDNGIKDTVNYIDNLYDSKLKPAIRLLDEFHREQQQILAELQAKWNEQQKFRLRNNLISSDPDNLETKEQIIQQNHMIKVLNNAIEGVGTSYDFKTINIEDF